MVALVLRGVGGAWMAGGLQGSIWGVGGGVAVGFQGSRHVSWLPGQSPSPRRLRNHSMPSPLLPVPPPPPEDGGRGRLPPALGERQRTGHQVRDVPYRDSKLTRVLAPLLARRCRTVVVGTVDLEDFPGTLATLTLGRTAGQATGPKVSLASLAGMKRSKGRGHWFLVNPHEEKRARTRPQLEHR